VFSYMEYILRKIDKIVKTLLVTKKNIFAQCLLKHPIVKGVLIKLKSRHTMLNLKYCGNVMLILVGNFIYQLEKRTRNPHI
jgi:hypothetical protein